jgi:hypothetical protein
MRQMGAGLLALLLGGDAPGLMRFNEPKHVSRPARHDRINPRK